MTSTPDQPATGQGSQALHRVLGIGLALMAVVFIALTVRGIAPLMHGDDVPPLVEYLPSGIAWAMMAAVIAVFRPRVPARQLGQSEAQYWSSTEVGATIAPTWFMAEAAGLLASVGFLMTGSLLTAITMAVANALYWWLRPSHFAQS